MKMHETFNQSKFSKLINSQSGRIFRIAAGFFFLIIGYMNRNQPLGVVSMIWGILPLTAGGFDLCFISALLGGPLSGTKIRSKKS